MKQLLFHIGADRYALRLRDVVRVLPLLELKRLPLAPDAVAGLMDFHGQSVPVIDLSLLAGAAPGRQHFDTRILLVKIRLDGPTPLKLGQRVEVTIEDTPAS